jgi:hypothetical protein
MEGDKVLSFHIWQLEPIEYFNRIEINQTFIFSVFSQATAICVSEKGETQVGYEPTILVIVASALTHLPIIVT